MAEWKIRRRHGECTRCESAFAQGARHSSVLRLDEEQDLLREDLCDACWKTAESEDFLFWWFTRFEVDRKQTLQLDLASLERLFMELEGREEEKLRELRYLLCLLLMRKRKLKLQKVLRNEKNEELVLRRPRREEELTVRVYDFTPDRIEELRSRLQEVLEGAGPAQESEDSGTEGQAGPAQDPAPVGEPGEGTAAPPLE
jgi:hypothetical protein